MRCYCVLHHGQPLELVERPIPHPQGTEVLVKVQAAGLCHTDLHLQEGHYDLGGGKKLALADRGSERSPEDNLAAMRPYTYASATSDDVVEQDHLVGWPTTRRCAATRPSSTA